ncbi:MAG: hypothetical protein ABWY06_25040 [Pseudomonas sp.]|uniref:hypothetical protein n=1 Tax=Pseudomonas sp. TaxID=306 RepID=UPI00339811D2
MDLYPDTLAEFEASPEVDWPLDEPVVPNALPVPTVYSPIDIADDRVLDRFC